ncbi:hypothetical protein V8C37DRAFT_408022 [Trichoderma ceciliae]
MTEFEAAFWLPRASQPFPASSLFQPTPVRLRNLFNAASTQPLLRTAHSNTSWRVCRLSRIATCPCCSVALLPVPSHSVKGRCPHRSPKRLLVAGLAFRVASTIVFICVALYYCVTTALPLQSTLTTTYLLPTLPLCADATAQLLPLRPPLASKSSFMPEPEPEPEATLQATANLSPVSPSPVHTAAPLVVPALQHTVDTIDAMVAAAASLPSRVADAPIVDPSLAPAGETDDIVDDDSFSDAYGEETEEMAVEPPQQELVDNNDDYAKTFDSPIGPEEGEDQEPQDVSSVPRESNENSSFLSDHLTSRPSDVSHIAADSSASAPAAQNPSLSTTQPEAGLEPASAAELQFSDAQAASTPPVAQPTLPGADPSRQDSGNSSPVDIQQLVADLTAHPAESSPGYPDPTSASATTVDVPAASNPFSPITTTTTVTTVTTATALPSSSSLPPRPPLPQVAPQSYASQHHPPGTNSNVSGSVGVPPTPGQPSTFAIAGAPGTSTEALGNLPPPPATAMNPSAAAASINPSPYPSNPPGYPVDRAQDAEYQRQWDQFMADERQYMSEAKWDRFPEGSRIFIGNLSSDKVSKRDVFDIFHRFGRLAQISLKSAYGFVQYHTVEEGRIALENLQGMEVKGRRIHKSKKERNRSPERARGRDGGRRGEKYRDDNRLTRNQSPRRNDYYGRTDRPDRPDRTDRADRTDRTDRTDSYGGRDRGYYDSARSRGRSRSPSGYGRNEKDSYRRRSPSPYNRSRHEAELDLPRRYGADVPDVQIIMQPDVNRDFGTWVEGAFKAKGLRTNVMYLHPRFPKDQVIQRQAAEGVHGVVDLDLRAQGMAKIPVHSFDRSGGIHNVRFEQYVDLEPSTAAEVILRAKASGAASYGQPYGSGAGGYPMQYGAQAPQPPHVAAYSGMQQPGAYPPQAAPSAPSAADLASLIGQVDNNTLQRLLSTIQAGSPGVMPGGLGHHGGAKPAAPAAANAPVDIQAILGSLSGGTAPQQHHASHPQMQYGAPYGGQPAAVSSVGVAQPAAGTGDAATQVQNIMAQLARYRQ